MINFNFKQEHILENDIALLRPLKEEDLQHLMYVSQQSEVWKFSTQKGNTEAALKTYIETALSGRNQQKEYPFVIIDKRTNEYAGCTRFYDIKLNQHNLSLGYTWYGLQHQGTGLNKHCKYLLFEFAFQHKFERLEFAADTENVRSIAAMKSIGCTEEGILRSNMIRLDGSRRDTIVLSMLKPEWDAHLKETLKNKLSSYAGK
jgi:RimJ/RimL family protein N-acetyltransferase